MIQCEHRSVPLFGMFAPVGQRQLRRCEREAKWVVKVNPPTKDNDGKVRLCDFCHEWEYQFFTHEPLSEKE